MIDNEFNSAMEAYQWLQAYQIIASCIFPKIDTGTSYCMAEQMYCANYLKLSDKVKFNSKVIKMVEEELNHLINKG